MYYAILLVFVSNLLSLHNQENANSNEAKPSTGAVRGLITFEDGTSGAEADVYLVALPEKFFTLPVNSLHTTCDAQGNFSYTDVPIGRYMVWAETKTHTSLQKFLQGHRLEVKADGQPVECKLNLRTGCSYHVTVLDAETKKPVPNAIIKFGWTDLDRKYVTDLDGRTEAGGLSESEWYFVVTADGYVMNDRKLGVQPLGSKSELIFELQRGMIVKGVVVDEQDRPIESVKVFFDYAVTSMRPSLGFATTNDEGEFVSPTLPVSEKLALRTWHEDLLETKSELTLDPTAPPKPLQLTVKQVMAHGDVIVRVVTENGMPIPDAEVWNRGQHDKWLQAKTDESGLARINRVYIREKNHNKGAEASLFIKKNDYLSTWHTVDIDLASIIPVQTRVILSQGVTIGGRLSNSKGEPLEGIRIVCLTNDGSLSTQSDKNGVFVLKNFPPSHRIDFLPSSPYATKRDLFLTGTDNDIILEYEGSVRVRAIDKTTSEPLPNFNVVLRESPTKKPGDPRPELHPHLASPGTDVISPIKEFVYSRLTVGSPVQITVSAEGYEPVTIDRVEAVPMEESKTLDVTLTPKSK
jgi:hypothetical protein